MPFSLTNEYVRSFLDPAAYGDWSHFQAAVDPEVRWRHGSEIHDPVTRTGVYNLKGWLEEIIGHLGAKMDPTVPLKVEFGEVIIHGLQAIVEAAGEARQKNGNPYRQWYAWFFTFSAETGKITKVNEYNNVHLVYEVATQN